MLLFRRQRTSSIKLFYATLTFLTYSALSACGGYTPLYSQPDGNDLTIKKHMALIQVQPIKNRIGHYLRNKLLVRLNPRGKPVNPLYTLTVTLEESSTNLGVKKTAVVTRGNLKILANFTLSRVVDKTPRAKSTELLTTTVTTISSYDIPQAQYAALTALKDAQSRALKEIADKMRTRLGIYFHQSSN